MAQCEGFRPGCTNEATHTDMGYAFCLECARAFAGYTPEPIRMSAQEIEQIAARRAYKAGLGASEWEACLLPHEMLDLMHAYKAERDALLAALEGMTTTEDEDPCRYDHHGYCQSHGLSLRPCRMEVARIVLAKVRGS